MRRGAVAAAILAALLSILAPASAQTNQEVTTVRVDATPCSTDIKDTEGNVLVTSYALYRPDGNWSVMLVNRDKNYPHTVRVLFEDSASQRTASFADPEAQVSFGSEQYVWKDRGLNSYADPQAPPVGGTVAGGSQATFTLPEASVTVLRGHVEQ